MVVRTFDAAVARASYRVRIRYLDTRIAWQRQKLMERTEDLDRTTGEDYARIVEIREQVQNAVQRREQLATIAEREWGETTW